ncbi:hypothetical protein BCR26_11530 [Enterococcus rivorum]|uniref:VWFA domain-containing protein n=1 Tax=Enterococcus rivorum TaxID=762845 RepID=A0A1E5KYV4_9ENTE|nr:hypothetical protein BCR26_11530 [Enterococcus rivorum]
MNSLSLLKGFLLFSGLIGLFYFVTYSSNFHESKIKAENPVIQTRLSPGEVALSKTATPVAGMVNQWDIKLRIEARNQFPPPATDVVLIIDTSGSMDETTLDGVKRMDKAKEAAEKFIEQVLKDDYINRIALVTYDKTAKSYTFTENGWTGQFVDSAHRNILIKAIKEIQPVGGTNTQAAIRTATEVMKQATNARRNMVLISDGVPTYSYPPTNPYNTVAGMESFKHSNSVIANQYNTYQTVKNIPESHFIYDDNDIAGLGGEYLFTGRPPHFPEPDDPKDRLYLNNANSAIAQATIAKQKQTLSGEKLVTDLYSIGLDMDLQPNPGDRPVGNETMKEIASSPDKCFSISSEDLEKIMLDIGGKIVGAVKTAKVVDPMGKGFELAEAVNDSNVSQGNVVVDKVKKEITWNMGALTEPISAHPNEDVMFVELNYRVNANKDVLDAIDSEDKAPTNGKTTIEYQDYNDDIQHKEFVVPKVKPTVVSLEKKLFDAKGAPITNETDSFEVTYGTDRFTKNDSFLIYSNNVVTKVVHPWQANVDYTVEEHLPISPKYDTEIKVNGQATLGNKATFKFLPITGEYEHQQIVITNKRVIEKKTVYLNIRQCVVKPQEELVIPSKGYYQAFMDNDNGTKQINLSSDSTSKDRATEIDESLFDKYEIVLSKDPSYYLALKDLVPEYYRFYGYIATKNNWNLKNKHLSTNDAELIKTNEAKLDYEGSDSYWVTMFITPKFGKDVNDIPEESPRPFSWSYKTNNFGK